MADYSHPFLLELIKRYPSEMVEDSIQYKGRFYFAFSWVWGRFETPVIIDMEMVARYGECETAWIAGKYQPYIQCNDNFDEKSFNKLYVSKIDNTNGYFRVMFELREGETIDPHEFDSSESEQ